MNEQYEYGYLIPLIGGYLLFLRWQDRPKTIAPDKPQLQGALGIACLALLAMIPLRIVYEANPDWRMVYWAQAGLTFLLSLALMVAWGGTRWLRHFWLPFAMMLFAVPWPTFLEDPLVQNLMQMVATITVEIVNFIGIHAVQKGNLIELPNGLVGVEEACSGVRSLQSTIMAAFFLGELFRFPGIWRVVALLIAPLVALIINTSRTLYLTIAVYDEGAEYMMDVHDMVGNIASIAAFIAMLLVALLMKKVLERTGQLSTDIPEPVSGSAYAPRLLKPVTPVAGLIILASSFVIAWGWFTANEPVTKQRLIADMHWDALPEEVEFTDIPEPTRAILRYDEGESVVWREPDGTYWNGFFFTWSKGKISSFAGIHRPDVCLPASGHTMQGEPETVEWQSPSGVTLPMKAYTFTYERPNGQVLTRYIFFGVWDDFPEAEVPLARTPAERIANAFEAKRILGRRSLQLIVTGMHDKAAAWEEAQAIMNTALEADMRQG